MLILGACFPFYYKKIARVMLKSNCFLSRVHFSVHEEFEQTLFSNIHELQYNGFSSMLSK